MGSLVVDVSAAVTRLLFQVAVIFNLPEWEHIICNQVLAADTHITRAAVNICITTRELAIGT